MSIPEVTPVMAPEVIPVPEVTPFGQPIDPAWVVPHVGQFDPPFGTPAPDLPAPAPARVATMKCSSCGKDKPVPAVPGRERYETDASGNVILNEFCPWCGRGEPPHLVDPAALATSGTPSDRRVPEVLIRERASRDNLDQAATDLALAQREQDAKDQAVRSRRAQDDADAAAAERARLAGGGAPTVADQGGAPFFAEPSVDPADAPGTPEFAARQAERDRISLGQ